jgi:hypothetical protein
MLFSILLRNRRFVTNIAYDEAAAHNKGIIINYKNTDEMIYEVLLTALNGS